MTEQTQTSEGRNLFHWYILISGTLIFSFYHSVLNWKSNVWKWLKIKIPQGRNKALTSNSPFSFVAFPVGLYVLFIPTEDLSTQCTVTRITNILPAQILFLLLPHQIVSSYTRRRKFAIFAAYRAPSQMLFASVATQWILRWELFNFLTHTRTLSAFFFLFTSHSLLCTGAVSHWLNPPGPLPCGPHTPLSAFPTMSS